MSALPPATVPISEVRQRRHEVAKQVAALTFDLGGLTYEMSQRNDFRIDVLVAKAAALKAADAELGELERLLAAAEEGVVGHCRRCQASHSRGAIYCWRCGESLAYAVPPAPAPAPAPAGSAPAPAGPASGPPTLDGVAVTGF